MEETRDFTARGPTETLDRTPEDGGRGAPAESAARAEAEAELDPAAAGRAWLEGLLNVLDFERGFLFVARSGEGRPPAEEPRLTLVASRARSATPPGSGFSDVPDPDAAAGRSAAERALSEGGAAASAGPPGGGGPPRVSLAASFPLYGDFRCVLVLDRGLQGGDVADAERELFDSASLGAAAAFRGAWCASELERLSSPGPALAAPSSAPGAAGAHGPSGEDAEPAPDVSEVPAYYGMVGRDERFQKVIRIVEKIKDTDLNICILGESGTGKEMLARAIHAASRRREKTFVAESCGSIPENLLESELFGHVRGAFTGADEDRKGLFELASGGTLFLDEIADMSEGMQRKLLRVLEEGVVRPIGGKHTVRIDTRVISASNRDLRALVQKNLFRADLYYRLNVISVEIPPLRERPGDIPILVAYVAEKVAEEEGVRKRFSKSAMAALKAYSWPGNVRELFNVVRRALLVSQGRLVSRRDIAGLLREDGVPPRFGRHVERRDDELVLRVPSRESFNEIIEECERAVLLDALSECGWNKSKVTKVLRIPRQSLYNKIARYQLEREWTAGGDRRPESVGPAGDSSRAGA